MSHAAIKFSVLSCAVQLLESASLAYDLFLPAVGACSGGISEPGVLESCGRQGAEHWMVHCKKMGGFQY